MRILVIGGTGTVGSLLVGELSSRKLEVHVLTRSPEKAKKLPPGVQGVTGDLLDPEAVRSAMDGVDRIFMLLATGPDETHQGIVAVNCARMAGVKYFVYMSVFNLERAPHVPHFGSKLPIEYVLKSSGVPYTILRPNHFFQNDYGQKDSLLERGVYGQPIGDAGLSRVDARDIAEAAAVTLTETGHQGNTYNVVGPEVLTGRSTAEVWGRALDRPIAYAGDDLDAWEKKMRRTLPGWKVFDYRLMYEALQKNGLRAEPGDVERMEKLLGHPPGSFEDFARETTEKWKKGGH